MHRTIVGQHAVLKRVATLTPSAREAAFDVLLSRPQMTTELLNACDNGSVRLNDLSLIQKQRLREYPDRHAAQSCWLST